MQARNTSEEESAFMRAWLQQVLKTSGMKPTPFARAAGLSPSTVLRALDPNGLVIMDRASVKKIVTTFGASPPDALAVSQQPEPEDLIEPEGTVSSFAGYKLASGQFVRRVGSRALELAGYVPGDVVLFDERIAPRRRDAVAITLNGHRTGFRQYDTPFVVTYSLCERDQQKPLLVDNVLTRIIAVAIKSLRERSI